MATTVIIPTIVVLFANVPSATVHPSAVPASVGTIAVSTETDAHPTPSVSTVNVPDAPPTAIVSPVSVTKVVVCTGLATRSTSVSRQSLAEAVMVVRRNVRRAHAGQIAKLVNVGVISVCMTHRNP